MELRVQGLGLTQSVVFPRRRYRRVHDDTCGFGFWGLRVLDSECGVEDWGLVVQGSWLRAESLGFKV